MTWLLKNEWRGASGREDITKVRNSQNEVMDPDFHILLLSHALGLPAPPFPSIKSGDNNIVHRLYLPKIVKMI